MNRLALVLAALRSGSALATTTVLTDEVTNGTVGVETTAPSAESVDYPKLSTTANDTTYEWWYFDGVSKTTNESAVVVFYNAGPDGFINFYDDGGVIQVDLSGTFANGTAFHTVVGATQATITTDSDSGSIAGDWADTGFSFSGSSVTADEVTYTVTIDSPAAGVTGSIELKSLAPAHYACSRTNAAGAAEQIMPNVYWSNAVPDATAAVSLAWDDGSRVAFGAGTGYHDKNWGDAPFASVVSTWYWGRAELGPYSLIWFDTFDAAATSNEYVSGFVAQDGEILLSSCADGAVSARPWGANSSFPPSYTTGPTQGLEVAYDLGNGSSLVANVTTGTVVMDTSGYIRTLGTVTGGLTDGEQYTGGRTMFEQFALSA